jgi:hypothetical protein
MKVLVTRADVKETVTKRSYKAAFILKWNETMKIGEETCKSRLLVHRSFKHTRVSEHLGISALTGKESSKPKLSSIFQHLNKTGHTASLDDFKILSSCAFHDELMIRESLLISKFKPSLNIQGSSVPLLLL